jgi:hypothetical protein
MPKDHIVINAMAAANHQEHLVEMFVTEFEIREWFKTVDLQQAWDTFRVAEGILEMRGSQRKRRKDAGKPRQATLTPDNGFEELMGS